MDQDQRFDAIIARTRAQMPLEPIEIEPKLAEPKSFLKVLRARHYNWRAARFSKIFGMRFSLKVPPLEQLNMIYYPAPVYELPIFIFFCLVTRRKVIAHLNVNCAFDDVAYQDKYVAPLGEQLCKYREFECADRYPDWMKKYRNDCTIYGMFPLDRLGELTSCMFDYLECYLSAVADQVEISDPERLKQIGVFQEQFKDDIRTQDKAQKMTARIIGAKTAKRIFYEVTT